MVTSLTETSDQTNKSFYTIMLFFFYLLLKYLGDLYFTIQNEHPNFF